MLLNSFIKGATMSRLHLSLGTRCCLLLVVVNCLLSTCLCRQAANCFGQEIPLGTWRAHLSYNDIHDVAIGNDKVYAASANGIMVVDRNDNSISTLTKLNGLSAADISALDFDISTNQLLIAYGDGRFDVVKTNRIQNYNPSQNASLSGSKRINDIAIQNSLAYLATDYGVVVFDLIRSEIKETWRNIGANGSRLKILQTAFLDDSVFLATEKGIMAGDINTNLLDFNRWKRFDTGAFNTTVHTVASFNSKVYSAINEAGIFLYQNGSWTKEDFLQDVSARSLQSSSFHLLISEGDRMWILDKVNILTQVTDNKITSPRLAKEGDKDKFWIGDMTMGLVTNVNGNFVNYLSNGPGTSRVFRLKYHDHKIYMVPGGFTSSYEGLLLQGELNVFEKGSWNTVLHPVTDLTDVAFIQSGKMYLSSFGYGVVEQDAQGNTNLFDESNSSLINVAPPQRNVNITALESTTEGLWVANYGADQSLHVYTNEQAWQSFSFPVQASRYPAHLATDFSGRVWMVLNPSQGGGIQVFDKAQNKYKYITNESNAGSLPDRAVRSIALDREGNMWVGTDRGVAYFFDAFSDAIKPVFENRFLLADDKVTAIAIDGGNRKWLGTERGVWLFNATGEELIYNFTAENSPLLSNAITDIEINSTTGEVFFATDRGIVSFRSDATESAPRFQEVKIFPNPVTSHFAGTVGISGLATDAVVKITDVRGKLLFQTIANGGTASWNLRDPSGKRVATGIFLVFAVKQDAAESMVGKIVVIE